MLRKINGLVSKTFTLEQKSGFKLERNKDWTFIVIIIDIDWYENNYRDNFLGHIAQPYIQVIHFIVSMCVPWELNPQPFALLMQSSTTEPQEHINLNVFRLGMCRSIGRRSVLADNHILRLDWCSYIWPISCTNRNLMMSRILCMGTYLVLQSCGGVEMLWHFEKQLKISFLSCKLADLRITAHIRLHGHRSWSWPL